MATYSIRPIALCEGPRDASQYTYRMNFGTGAKSVSYIWYIEGSQPKTIVDTGVPAVGGFGTELTSVDDGFAKLGLKPEDIEIVIVTHLHNDHIVLSSLYKQAKFIVQKKELDYTQNPHPIDAYIYDRKMFENLDLEVIDGEKEIIPGVSVFLSPGHSPGGQSVEVNTTAGKAIITGFCCQLSTFEQTDTMKRMGWEVAAPLIHHDVRQVYDSALEVKRRADIILALHDPAFVGKETIP
ncbi:MBL fold metallo-hydrolase [Chloroflexota bacterium]